MIIRSFLSVGYGCGYGYGSVGGWGSGGGVGYGNRRGLNTLTRVFTTPPRTLLELGASPHNNTILRYLIPETVDKVTDGRQILPRQVKHAHYTLVHPEPVPKPTLLAASIECAQLLNMDLSELSSQTFVNLFSGNNQVIPGFENSYATVYGCHSFGQWFGQLGDGRALSIGEVHNIVHVKKEEEEDSTSPSSSPSSPSSSSSLPHSEDSSNYLEIQELQLKGCGRSPYSRGFDGRAVMRSSIREFLISEAMYHLNVPTTRALCIIGTGQKVRRAWYTASSQYNPYKPIFDSEVTNHPVQQRGNMKFPPDSMHSEAVCLREYPHLLTIVSSDEQHLSTTKSYRLKDLPERIEPGPPLRYVELFRCISHNAANLVAQWLRVGYIQGNMNSDNTLLGGRTVDYGPYGWMEKYDPLYQPFTTDTMNNFAFKNQPNAMAINVAILAETTFIPLIRHLYGENRYSPECEAYVTMIRNIAEEEFAETFQKIYEEVQRNKLGLRKEEEGDEGLFSELLELMQKSEADYTIFFRELGNLRMDKEMTKDYVEELFKQLMIAFYSESKATENSELWMQWLRNYSARVKRDGTTWQERRSIMHQVNPKYVLRNWMSMLAYESAEHKEDYTVIEELMKLLKDPYSEQTSFDERAWYQKTPPWAQHLPGATFMSCSS
eukprot:scaffold300_cov173-Ochromonas_danica.AAC.6